jgi:TIR domain
MSSQTRIRPAAAAIAGVVKRPWSHALFGYDVFISYTRRDAREYANALAITLHRDHDLVVFLDDQEFDVGERLPVLLRAARRSRMVVLLASPQVSLSRFVPKEVAAAQAKGRRILPIDVAGTLAGNAAGPELMAALQDEKWETETNALADGPSPTVVAAILRSRGGLKRRVQQRLFYASILLVLLALTGYAFRLAAQREAALRAETLRAEHARRLAYASQLRLANELAPREPARATVALDDGSRSPADLRDVTWNLIAAASRRELWTAPAAWGPQTWLDYLPDGRLFSLGKDGAARITQPGAASVPEPIARIDGTPLWFDPQHDALVVRTPSGELAIWNPARGAEMRRVDPRPSPAPGANAAVNAREREVAAIHAAALSSSGRTLAAVAATTIRFWDVSTGTELRDREFGPQSLGAETLPAHPVAVQPIAGGPEAFVSAVTQDLEDGYYRAVAIRLEHGGTPAVVAQEGSARAVGLSVAPGSGRVAMHVKSSDAEIAHYAGHSRVALYESASPRSRTTFTHQLTQQTVTALALDTKGDRLAMATDRGTIRIVDAASGGLQAEVGVPGALTSIAVHPSGDRLAVLSKEGRASEQLAYLPRPSIVATT